MTVATDWVEEGREISSALDAYHAVIVAGSDPTATAEVALGIGRVQARRRRVAIGDLLGDAAPLQELVPGDDPHGIVDSFLYGVSLNRIAYQVPDAGELFIMPSGTEPIDYDELFVNARWRRLAAGFREVGALLVIAAPAGATHLRELVDMMDGAVLVGDEVPGDLAVAQSLAWVRERRHAPMSVAVAEPQAAMEPVLEPDPLEVVPIPTRRERKRLLAGVAGLLMTLGLGGALFWFAYRPFASEPKDRRGGGPAAATAAVGSALGTDSAILARNALRDSAARDSAARAANLAVLGDSFPVLTPVNPTDSATASAFSVMLENTNGLPGAILDMRARYASVPAGSYGLDPRTRYYQLTAGAYQTRAGAESLLVQLRARRILSPGFGNIALLPLAFLVEANVPEAEVRTRLARAAARAQPVYALRQQNGSVNLYFGAYENPQQASLAVPAVRKSGVEPTLVYRTGRVF